MKLRVIRKVDKEKDARKYNWALEVCEKLGKEKVGAVQMTGLLHLDRLLRG